MKKLVAIGISAIFAIGVLAACGSDPVAVPNVLGYRLDDAHNKLKDAGFEKFDDVDVIENRTPFMHSNWVVVAQSPASTESAKTGDRIRLEVGKVEDDGIAQRLPSDSPVASELARKGEAAKQEQAEARKARQAEAKEFVKENDAHIRQARNVFTISLLGVRNAIAEQGDATQSDMNLISDFQRAMGLYWEVLESAPDSINSAADGIQEAINEFKRASQMRVSASGPYASESLAEFDKIYAAAKRKYNDNLTKMYRGSGTKAPTL